MTRSTAREIAIHLAYQLSFTELPVEEFLDQQLSDERFSELAAEEAVEEAPPQPVRTAASIREATDRETNCLQCINKIPQKFRI